MDESCLTTEKHLQGQTPYPQSQHCLPIGCDLSKIFWPGLVSIAHHANNHLAVEFGIYWWVWGTRIHL